MKILLTVAGSRSGHEFFHSLLDGHSQILQFPGWFSFNNPARFALPNMRGKENFYKIFNLKNVHKIPNEFINQYPYFFNSKINRIERHNQLGKKKDKYFKVDKKKFIKFFLIYIKKKEVSKFNILLSLHFAYELAKGKKIKGKKIILVNTHTIVGAKKFIEFMQIKDLEVIHTMRNPISGLSSPINNWLKYKNGKYFFYNSLFYHFDLVFRGLKNLLYLKRKIFVIQLEKLHRDNNKVMKDFCKIFKLKFENCLKKSTWHNLEWWGDQVSGKYLNGVNTKFKIEYKNDIFFNRDISFFEFLAKDIIRHYGYNFSSKLNKRYFFNFLPMKCELIIWKNTLKQRAIFHVLSLPYYYFKRILFINKFTMKNKNLPYSIGSK